MKILNRFNDAVLFEADCETTKQLVEKAVKEKADLRDANLGGADLRGTDLRGTDLRDADLSGTDLRGTDLRDADLRGADLSGTDLSGTDLSGTDLRGADLSGTDLSGTDLSDADLRGVKGIPPVPIVPDLDNKILASVEGGKFLKMDQWHTCETTHCRGGWAIVHAGEAGRVLEDAVGSQPAAALIYEASTGRVPNFYAENDEALEDIVHDAIIKARDAKTE